MPASLDGIRVLDLTRVLAGPSCTQILGDLGAEVIKIERPGAGDDSRRFGPPYLKDGNGHDTGESTYFLSCNRNKRSVTIDVAKPEGQELIRRLLAHCDVLVENFKVGDLSRYGLGYPQLREIHPRLVYCSITGFGQTGPYAGRGGYDFLAQGMGGMMSLTGEPEGRPVRVGIGNADLLTGAYATIGILAALRHRDVTGRGQHIDMALLDCQLAWMSYEAVKFMVTGEEPQRVGNGHPNIMPYNVFEAADGFLILAIGNDGQFLRFCRFAGVPELAEDERFGTNAARVRHRDILFPIIAEIIGRHPRRHWLEGLEPLQVPAGPVNSLAEAFGDPQAQARGMAVTLAHPLSPAPLPLVANPVRLSESPPEYRRAPPTLGQHTDEVLTEILEMLPAELAQLRHDGTI